jgi:hypothetical protein
LSILSPAFVLGYHGCEEEIAEEILCSSKHLKISKNEYDWLGSGVYFWEGDPKRAQEWAEEKAKKGEIKKPAIVGAIIDLGNCLNLSTIGGVELIKQAYKVYENLRVTAGQSLHRNTDPPQSKIKDKLIRRLDYAVIEQLHQMLKEANIEPYQTVRGMFLEGDEAYPGAGILERTHTQIAVRDTSCIIGYFRPRIT